MAQKYYLLYTTDIWKGNKCVCCVTADPSRIKTVIRRFIRSDDMEYGYDSDMFKAKQLEALEKDWGEKDPYDINNGLRYGLIEEVEDGEVFF